MRHFKGLLIVTAVALALGLLFTFVLSITLAPLSLGGSVTPPGCRAGEGSLWQEAKSPDGKLRAQLIEFGGPTNDFIFDVVLISPEEKGTVAVIETEYPLLDRASPFTLSWSDARTLIIKGRSARVHEYKSFWYPTLQGSAGKDAVVIKLQFDHLE